MRFFSFLLFLAFSSSSYAVDLTLPKAVLGQPGDFVTIQAKTTGTVVKWIAIDNGLRLIPAEMLKDSKTAIVISSNPGTYRLFAYTSDASGPSDPQMITVTIAGPAPSPAPAPVPMPAPDPAPISAPGFRVLVIYDTATASSLPAKQLDCIFSTSVRGYLAEKCIRGTDAKTPEFRFYDVNTDPTSDGQLWADAMKRPRKSLPWVIISDGSKGYEGPLPGNVDDFLALLKKYGG